MVQGWGTYNDNWYFVIIKSFSSNAFHYLYWIENNFVSLIKFVIFVVS